MCSKMISLARLITITAVLFSLAACDNRSEQQQKPAPQTKITEQQPKKTSPDPQKITIAQFGHVFVYLPLYIAKEKGFFTEQGLDVTYVSTGGDEKTWAAVTSGSAQFGVADPTFVAIARERGDNQGQIIASVIDGVPFWGVSRKPLTIQTPKDLDGLRVATYPAPSTNFALMDKIVKENHLSTEVVQGAFGSLLAILENGKADMAMVLEPTASLAAAQGYKVVFTYKGLYDDFALTGLSTTRSFITNHPDVCQKIVNALQKAYRYAYENPVGAIQVARKVFPDVDPAAVENGVRRMINDGTIPTSALIKKASWQMAIDLRRQIGDLKHDAPFADNVNNRFAKTAETQMTRADAGH